MIGLLLVNQIEDYHEDKQMNVLTSSVRWGLKKASLVSLVHSRDERSSARRVQHARQDPIRLRGCRTDVRSVRCDPAVPFQTISGRNFVGDHTRAGSSSTSTAVGCSGSIVVLCSRAAVGAGGRAELDLSGRAFTAVESC
jgi:hypothetical protein